MTFWGYFLQYAIIMVILAVIGIAGACVGKMLRVRKDAKTASLEGQDEK